MARIQRVYAAEAAVFGLPVTAAFVYAFPWLVLGPALMWPQSPSSAGRAALWGACCVIALLAFWHLAALTVQGRRYPFGYPFWVGTATGAFALSDVIRWSESPMVLGVFVAPALCAAHFAFVQLQKIKNEAKQLHRPWLTSNVRPKLNWLKTLASGTKEARTHSTIPEDRTLTVAEADFIRWMLSHGNDRSRHFLPQVDQARVVGRCTCGCTSIDLAISGVTHYPHAGMETLCAFRWTAVDGEFEVFAFACGDFLAGIDLWAVWGQYPASYLPSTSLLVPAPSGDSRQGAGE